MSAKKTVLIYTPEQLRASSLICSRWPIIDETDITSLTSYLEHGHPLSIAKNEGVIHEFEQEFNKELNLNRKYALSFNSGTNALYAAFAACFVQPGVDVIAAGYTFHATVTPAIALGAKVHLIDSNPRNGNITLEIVREAMIDIPTATVIAINHNWGIPVEDIESIVALAHSRGMYVIEDCSHAHGATIDDQPVGTFGDISIFSLQANKLIVAGEGGIALTDNPNLYVAMKAQGHYRRMEDPFLQNRDTAEFERYIETGVGGVKFRIAALSAVMALSQMKKFRNILEARRKYARKLQEAVFDIQWLKFPEFNANRSCPSWYNIRLKYLPTKNNNISVTEVVKKMQDSGMDVHLGTSIPLSELLIFQQNPQTYPFRNIYRPLYKAGDLPNSSSFCENTIVFPVFSKDDTLSQTVTSAYIEIIYHMQKNQLTYD